MRTNMRLIGFLNRAIEKIEQSDEYQWGHSGACNCGHLAQVMTGHSKSELLEYSQVREGDWTQQAELYCETSGEKIDNVIAKMLSEGLNLEDIQHIEYLNNPKILQHLEGGMRFLERNQKANVILYFQAWITLLEDLDRQGKDWSAKDSEISGEVEIHDSIPEHA